MFAQRGFDGCSMEDIAKASGITKPMLYAYFDSKEGLFAACAQRAGAQLRDDLREVGEREDLTPDRQLWEGLQRVFAFVDEHHDSWLLLYPEGAPAPGSIGSGAVAARDAMADLLTELFTRAARAQGLSDEALAHIEGIAHSFTAATIGGRVALGEAGRGAARGRRAPADEPALDGLRIASRGSSLAAAMTFVKVSGLTDSRDPTTKRGLAQDESLPCPPRRSRLSPPRPDGPGVDRSGRRDHRARVLRSPASTTLTTTRRAPSRRRRVTSSSRTSRATPARRSTSCGRTRPARTALRPSSGVNAFFAEAEQVEHIAEHTPSPVLRRRHDRVVHAPADGPGLGRREGAGRGADRRRGGQ